VALWHEVTRTQSDGRLSIDRLNDDVTNSLRNEYSKFTLQIVKSIKIRVMT